MMITRFVGVKLSPKSKGRQLIQAHDWKWGSQMLKKTISLSCILFLLLFSSPGFGQIEWSGFADILHQTDLEEGGAGFSYGQFEIDASAEILPGLVFEGAVALNPETGGLEAGAGFLDMTIHEELGLGLMCGQFDVPFGLDWEHIASPDRLLITAPMLNEMTINSWNDVGLNLYGGSDLLSLTAFMVNGADDGFALGCRLGVTPVELIGLGVSFYSQTAENDAASRPQVLGVDLQSSLGPVAFRGEYHQADDLFEGDFGAIDGIETHAGFYGQADLDLSSFVNLPLTAIGRFDDWSTDSGSSDGSKMTLGLAYEVAESFGLRSEYHAVDLDGVQSKQLIFQALVSF